METAELTEIMRTGDTAFMGILNKVRRGILDNEVQEFLRSHTVTEAQAEKIEGTRIFSRLSEVSKYNDKRMAEIDAPVETYEAEIEIYTMFNQDKARKKLIAAMPVEEKLTLKPGALVMIRKNNLLDGYANGSLGHYQEKCGGALCVKLLNGNDVYIDQMEFAQKDGEGKVQASAFQYPLTLAWASTIHKAQGATLETVIADLRHLWDSGQAYVAMSRTKTAEGFHVLNWSRDAVIIDQRVRQFYGFDSEKSL